MANQADLSLRTMCRVLGVSPRGFYAWRERSPSQRSIANSVMTERLRQIHQDSYESYGMPWVRARAHQPSARGASHARSRYPRHQQTPRLSPPAATSIRLRPMTWSTSAFTPLARTSCGWPTCPVCRLGWGLSIWRWSSMSGAGAWWVEPWVSACRKSRARWHEAKWQQDHHTSDHARATCGCNSQRSQPIANQPLTDDCSRQNSAGYCQQTGQPRPTQSIISTDRKMAIRGGAAPSFGTLNEQFSGELPLPDPRGPWPALRPIGT